MPDPAHTIIVAFTVHAPTMAQAQARLMDRLPNPEADRHAVIDSWWIAEDERYDGSDNDSAVFVPMGEQEKWHRKVEDSRGSVPCPECDGRGGDNPANTAYQEPCANCWGRGWVLPGDEEDE